MSKLLFSLPPLSPDYSGAASVLHDLGALVIIHDASGCTGTYTGYDEPRWYGSRSPLFCSGLRELDAVMGDDDKLLSKIKAFAAVSKPPLAAVIGSPVPMVVGFDFQGFASLVEAETGIPCLGFATNGLGLYDQGQRDVYLALERRFVRDDAPPAPRSVNLLGASVLDGLDTESVDCLCGMLEAAGMSVVSVWGSRSGLGELSRAGAAGANWVLTSAALPLARRLEERFGQPYVAGLPIGALETKRILDGLEAAVSGRPPDHGFPASFSPPMSAPGREAPGAHAALIVGEALLASSLGGFLARDLGIPDVRAATFFGGDPELDNLGIRRLENESDAIRMFSDPNLTAILGDPLFASLTPPDNRPAWIPLSHRAVSGRLYEDSRARLFGSNAESAFIDLPSSAREAS